MKHLILLRELYKFTDGKSVCVLTSPPGRHGRALVVGDGDPEAVGAGAAGQAAVARVHAVAANQR